MFVLFTMDAQNAEWILVNPTKLEGLSHNEFFRVLIHVQQLFIYNDDEDFNRLKENDSAFVNRC